MGTVTPRMVERAIQLVRMGMDAEHAVARALAEHRFRYGTEAEHVRAVCVLRAVLIGVGPARARPPGLTTGAVGPPGGLPRFQVQALPDDAMRLGVEYRDQVRALLERRTSTGQVSSVAGATRARACSGPGCPHKGVTRDPATREWRCRAHRTSPRTRGVWPAVEGDGRCQVPGCGLDHRALLTVSAAPARSGPAPAPRSPGAADVQRRGGAPPGVARRPVEGTPPEPPRRRAGRFTNIPRWVATS